jgi:O-antigen/teichoic acid export membrane protein
MLTARGQQRLNLLFVALLFVLYALLCWRLIPAIGPPGAAMSVVTAALLLTLCCVSALPWSSTRLSPRPMGGA